MLLFRLSSIQVLSSVLLADTSGHTCGRDDNFVADTGYKYNVDDDKGYKWIQLKRPVA